jgi:hypothetical protein
MREHSEDSLPGTQCASDPHEDICAVNSPVTHIPDTLYISSASMSTSRTVMMTRLCVIICNCTKSKCEGFT